MKRQVLAVFACVAVVLAACEREDRDPRPDPVLGDGSRPVPVTSLAPGGKQPHSGNPEADKFKTSAFYLSEGKRLFGWYNCSGCHANGGGGMGPALMDDKWLYGGSIENIHATIRDGRPNGMPSFRNLIPDEQIWEIAGYVLSLGGNVRSDSAPSRNDDMMVHPSENRMPNATTLGKSP